MADADKIAHWFCGQGLWERVSAALWNDWRWQMQNRITSREQLENLLDLTDDERAGLDAMQNKFSTIITPHFFNLIERGNANCPIRKQVVPAMAETFCGNDESLDPLAEERDSPVPNLVHRYPDRVLLLATNICAAHCRFCTRSRIVAGTPIEPDLTAALDYIRSHREIRDVLISGGDPLLLSDEKLDALLGALRAIEHLEFVRIGSRVPVFLPQRITPALCKIFKKHGPIWLSIHVNHPRELTHETAAALENLAFSGTVLGAQTVLLRGVNDDAGTLKSLVHRLLQVRVRPYYLYACDRVAGTSRFRVPVARGIELIRALRGWTSGYAVPQFVIDAPNGGGKIPINPNYLESIDENGVCHLRNFRGNEYLY